MRRRIKVIQLSQLLLVTCLVELVDCGRGMRRRISDTTVSAVAYDVLLVAGGGLVDCGRRMRRMEKNKKYSCLNCCL